MRTLTLRRRSLGPSIAVSAPAGRSWPRRRSTRFAGRRTRVQLEDCPNQIVVSVAPSAGNIGFEMQVKGRNVLHFPYASLEEFKAKPGLAGIPFLGAVGQSP